MSGWIDTSKSYDIYPNDRLLSLADFLAELAGAAGIDPEISGKEILAVSEIKLDLPIELDLLQERGVWEIDAAPPTQKIETTVMPVLHRVRLRVSVDDGEYNLNAVES